MGYQFQFSQHQINMLSTVAIVTVWIQKLEIRNRQLLTRGSLITDEPGSLGPDSLGQYWGVNEFNALFCLISPEIIQQSDQVVG